VIDWQYKKVLSLYSDVKMSLDVDDDLFFSCQV